MQTSGPWVSICETATETQAVVVGGAPGLTWSLTPWCLLQEGGGRHTCPWCPQWPLVHFLCTDGLHTERSGSPRGVLAPRCYRAGRPGWTTAQGLRHPLPSFAAAKPGGQQQAQWPEGRQAGGHREKGGHCLPTPSKAQGPTRGSLWGGTGRPFFTAATTARWTRFFAISPQTNKPQRAWSTGARTLGLQQPGCPLPRPRKLMCLVGRRSCCPEPEPAGAGSGTSGLRKSLPMWDGAAPPRSGGLAVSLHLPPTYLVQRLALECPRRRGEGVVAPPPPHFLQ